MFRFGTAASLIIALGFLGCERGETRQAGKPGVPTGAAPPDGRMPKEGKGADTGFIAYISLRNESAPCPRIGEPIQVRYELQNRSRQSRLIMHQGFWPDHGIFVQTAAGMPVPRTDLGEEYQRLFDSPDPPTEKIATRMLEPGQTDDAWEPIELTELFQLDQPGDYRVYVRYRDRAGLDVESNTLSFALLP